jgi:hypothetical protein
MSNARMLLEMSADGEAVPSGRGGRGMSSLRFAKGGNPRRVLVSNIRGRKLTHKQGTTYETSLNPCTV